ncbi:MAG: type IV secretory system conjugative DNA transfer family protein [Alicyclobacillus sp.]|nr:type IV secretory system conjugative DNA transfer family protein [Alicyclobacillus sp.]
MTTKQNMFRWAIRAVLWAVLLVVDFRILPALGHLHGYIRIADPNLFANYWLLALSGHWSWHPQWHSQSWWIMQGVMILLATAVYWGTRGGLAARLSKLSTAAAATHGSARWRTRREWGRTLDKQLMDTPTAAGIVVGSGAGTTWTTKPAWGNPHVLVIGATRSGKSRRVILPSIWAIGHAGESMVLTDPKGELHTMTAAWLRQQGYEVIQINLLHPTAANRWNPFTAIEQAREQGDTEEAVRLAWELADVIVSDNGQTDPIWPQAEQSLISALSLGVVWEASQAAKHPATAYRILTELGQDGGEQLDAWFRSLPSDHPARLAYGTAALSESRTRSSIYTGTAAHMRLYADTGIAAMTSISDHDPASVGVKPTAVFLLLPDEAASRRTIASLYITQLYSALTTVARDCGGTLPTPVWFVADEFANMGKIPDMSGKMTVSAGRGIRWLLAIQSLSQIEQVYGRQAAETITGNCDTWLYLRTADPQTAKVISAKAGQYTVRTYSQSQQSRQPSVLGLSESVTGRPLIMPDEVLRWPQGQSLLLQSGEYAAQLPLADLSEWPLASKAFDARQAFSGQRGVSTAHVETWVPDTTQPAVSSTDKIKKTNASRLFGKGNKSKSQED